MRFARCSAMLGACALVFALSACSSDSLPPPKDDGKVTPVDAAADGKKPTPDLPPGSEGIKTDGPSVTPDIGERLDAPPPECVGKTDGTACGAGGLEICLKEQCVASRCGDGYIDTAAGEECEDGNTTSGDGCTTCKFDCKAAADCDDKNPCNGTETCDTATHVCKAGTPPGGTPACTLPTGGAGVCSNGVCVTAGCGNGVKDGNEECDDANKVSGDGCENDCTLTCKADKDCDDGDLCNGKETCDKTNAAVPVCKAGTAISCTTTNCTGSCEASTGKCIYADLDKDGSTCDKDCNDADPSVYPGAFECKDGKDNDCDPKTLDSAGGDCTCYKDNDKDGFANTTTGSIVNVTCPTGYTRTKPTDATNTDCWDSRADVNPGQTSYFTSYFCKKYDFITGKCLSSSWDYNCDGLVTQQYKSSYAGKCTPLTLPPFGKTVCLGAGWKGLTIPACGTAATYYSCNLIGSSCLTASASRTQACR